MVAGIIAAESAAYWEARFEGEDVCCTLVRDLSEALADPAVVGRHRVRSGGGAAVDLLAIPGAVNTDGAPACGQDNQRFGF